MKFDKDTVSLNKDELEKDLKDLIAEHNAALEQENLAREIKLKLKGRIDLTSELLNKISAYEAEEKENSKKKGK